jgi:hypothetical protein
MAKLGYQRAGTGFWRMAEVDRCLEFADFVKTAVTCGYSLVLGVVDDALLVGCVREDMLGLLIRCSRVRTSVGDSRFRRADDVRAAQHVVTFGGRRHRSMVVRSVAAGVVLRWLRCGDECGE